MENTNPFSEKIDPRSYVTRFVRPNSSTSQQYEVHNLLYRQPELYEKVYPVYDDQLPKMCQQIFDRYLRHYPSSILDIGCGPGRELNALARNLSDCVGIDYLPEMVRYAQSKYPTLTFKRMICEQFRFSSEVRGNFMLGMGNNLCPN